LGLTWAQERKAGIASGHSSPAFDASLVASPNARRESVCDDLELLTLTISVPADAADARCEFSGVG
jgi:hypothetical protein